MLTHETELRTVDGFAVEVIPARQPTLHAPRITMLHGMCDTGPDICAFTSPLVTPVGDLVCPSGNVACGGASDWRGDGDTKEAFVSRALEAAAAHLGPDDSGRDVLMGFSRGAFAARDIAYASGGRWRGLVLLGAAMQPDADRLRAAGIRRVLLASGDLDGARPTMVSAAAHLCAQGMPARFVGLGPIYHALPADLPDRLREGFAWVTSSAGDDGACGS